MSATPEQFVDGRRIVKIGKANDIEKRIKQLDSEQSSYQKHTAIHEFSLHNNFCSVSYIHSLIKPYSKFSSRNGNFIFGNNSFNYIHLSNV